MANWLQNLIGAAHLLLTLVLIAVLCLGAWGCISLDRQVYTLLEDADNVLRHPVDPDAAAQSRAILASARAIVEDAATMSHRLAYPSKSQQVLNGLSKLIPRIF